MRLWISVIAMCALPYCAHATAVIFDFDTGAPSLKTGMPIPFDQTSDGLTASFGSTPAGAFSIQNAGSTGFFLSLFSGNYIYDNNLDRNTIVISFSQPLTSVSLAFATADQNQTEVPTSILLAAYVDSTANPSVGSTMTHGTYGMDTFPMGTLSFDSAAQPFNVVTLVLPPQVLGVTDFFVDNISVTTAAVAPAPAIPEPGSFSLTVTAALLFGGIVAGGKKLGKRN